MKKSSHFSTVYSGKDVTACFHISFVNYKHVRTLYGEECCAEISEVIQNHLYIFGFSFLWAFKDECVVSVNLGGGATKLMAEALLLFFATNNFFGRYLPIMPILSISEVVSSSVSSRDHTSIKSVSTSFPMMLAPPQNTSAWRARYEFEMNLCQRLIDVLEKGKCSLNLQPVYDISGTAILYSEALIRFSDDRARIDTQRAISAFEKTGQIRLVDRYVLSAVIGRLQTDSSAVIACNISALSFNLDFWWESVLRVLRKNPSVANRLIVELTEGAAIDDHSAFIKFVKSLRSLGVRFALDDFGTGVPRTAAIKSFTFDYVKLDKSIIRSLSSDFMGSDAALNAVTYFQDAGSKVIAEGIESEDDVLNARRLGCSYMQGYFLGGPSSKNKISINVMNKNEYSAMGLCV